jgi:hypothetical protein
LRPDNGFLREDDGSLRLEYGSRREEIRSQSPGRSIPNRTGLARRGIGGETEGLQKGIVP